MKQRIIALALAVAALLGMQAVVAASAHAASGNTADTLCVEEDNNLWLSEHRFCLELARWEYDLSSTAGNVDLTKIVISGGPFSDGRMDRIYDIDIRVIKNGTVIWAIHDQTLTASDTADWWYPDLAPAAELNVTAYFTFGMVNAPDERRSMSRWIS